MKSDDPQAVAVARERIRKALVLIEQAQNDLNAARIELSEVTHFAPLWTKAGKLYDDIKAFWYRVDAARSKGGFGLSELHCELLEQDISRLTGARSSSYEKL